MWALVAVLMPCTPAAAQPCASVDAEVDALVRGGSDPQVVLDIARDLGVRGMPALIVRAEGGDATAILALGLTSEVGALRAIRERAIRRQPERALALLALGDGTETGTVTRALTGPGSPAERARVARYLGRLRHVRAREILELGLVDPDPLVRLEAAKPLARARHPKARRVLRDLTRAGPDAIRTAAKEASERAPTGDAEELMDELEGEPTEASPPSKDGGIVQRPPDPADTLSVARAGLSGPGGGVLRAAIRLMELGSARGEVTALVAVARRRDVSTDTRASALRAALRLCPK